MASKTPKAIIRIGALPDSRLRQALNGTVDNARKVSEQVSKEEVKNARRTEKEKTRISEQSVKQAMRHAGIMRRESQKTARSLARDAQRVQRARKRSLDQSTRDEERANRRRGRRGLGAGLAGAAIGAAQGAVGLVGRGQGLAGVQSLEQRLGTAGDFRETLIRKSNESGLTDAEREQVEENLLRASEATNVSLMDLVNGMAQAQTRFDQFRQFGAIMGDVAQVSAATGESVEDLVGAIGTATKVFQLDEQGQREFIDALVSTSQRGTIGVGDFSRDMAAIMGNFQIATERTGIEGAREFLALAQTIGTSQAGSAESGTMIARLIQELQKKDVQEKLRDIDIDVTEDGKIGGRLRNIGAIGADLGRNEKFQSSLVRQDIFREIRGKKGAEFLMSAIQKEGDAFTKLSGIETGLGAASVNKTVGDLFADPTFKLRNLGVKAQAETVRDSDRIVETVAPAVTELTKLQMQFPLLTESMGTLTSTLRWAVGAMIADRLLGGGGGGGGAGGALGGFLKNPKAAAGVFGAAGIGGKLGVLGAGLAGFGITHGLLKLTGGDEVLQGAGSKLAGLFGAGNDTDIQRSDERGTGLRQQFTVSPKAKAEPTKLAEDTIKALKQNAKAKITVEVVGPGRVTGTRTNEGADVDVRSGLAGTVPP